MGVRSALYGEPAMRRQSKERRPLIVRVPCLKPRTCARGDFGVLQYSPGRTEGDRTRTPGDIRSGRGTVMHETLERVLDATTARNGKKASQELDELPVLPNYGRTAE